MTSLSALTVAIKCHRDWRVLHSIDSIDAECVDVVVVISPDPPLERAVRDRGARTVSIRPGRQGDSSQTCI